MVHRAADGEQKSTMLDLQHHTHTFTTLNGNSTNYATHKSQLRNEIPPLLPFPDYVFLPEFLADIILDTVDRETSAS